MKFTYLVPAVVCLLNAITSVNAVTIISVNENCMQTMDHETTGQYACEAGTYCDLMPTAQQIPPVCKPVCATCYVAPAEVIDGHNMPPSSKRCDEGYASYQTAWVSGENACNICEKGWYSTDSTQNGMGSYVSGTTPYPGNVGCTKCPEGLTTQGRGAGILPSDCTFFGQLADEEWKPDIQDGTDLETVKTLAIQRIAVSQFMLLEAAKIQRSYESALRLAQISSEEMIKSVSAMSGSFAQQEEVLSKVSEAFDPTTGKLTCMNDLSCRMVKRAAYYEQMKTPDFHVDLACIKETEGSTTKGACVSAPLLEGDPVPECINTCGNTCMTEEATMKGQTLEVWKEAHEQVAEPLTPELCSCFSACPIDSCTSEADKAKVSHALRDMCHMKDPFHVPANVTTTGGNNLKCGFGQYVKYKNVPNMEVCTDCPPGRFAKAKTSRNKECKKCPRGWIQPRSKQGRCIRCYSGKKANRERTACV